MIGTGLAILGLLGAGATAYGANKASQAQQDAANQAASVQREGMQNALAFQKDVFGKQVENYGQAGANLDPFIKTGTGATNLLSSFYGLNGTDPALGKNALAAFQGSPDYQFALKGGSEALDNSAAAKGSALGGNQIRAQTEYGSGLATQSLRDYLTRLTGMAGQGIQAGGMLGQMGTSIGNGVVGANTAANITGSNNIAQSNMAAGTAEAAGINGMVKGFDSGLNTLSLYNQMGKSSYAPNNYLSSYNGNQIGGLY